jgi:hypothetical protein
MYNNYVRVHRFSQPLVPLVGKRSQFYGVKVIYAHRCVVEWQLFNS